MESLKEERIEDDNAAGEAHQDVQVPMTKQEIENMNYNSFKQFKANLLGANKKTSTALKPDASATAGGKSLPESV